jgi:hypothetical protein
MGRQVCRAEEDCPGGLAGLVGLFDWVVCFWVSLGVSIVNWSMFGIKGFWRVRDHVLEGGGQGVVEGELWRRRL